MFTPQRKGWSVTSRAAAEKNGPLPWKGKGVAVGEGPPPPRDSLEENGGDGGGTREADVWRSFRDAGMLDDEGFERKERGALLQRVAKLEAELYDYQYNMGLLLIEKKEWTSKYNELQQGLIDAEEILKREQAAHLGVVSEMEKREENLKKALGVEKQCVTDLENALREMRAGHAEEKFTCDKNMADANALLAEIEEKSLEAEAKQRAADARLAELSRKSSEIERKLQDLASQESILHRERASLNIEKELHSEELKRQRVDMQNWEKSLREGQERLVDSQNLLNQRERRSNESDKIVAKKEKELDAMRDTIEKTIHSLREKEEYVDLRLTALSHKEMEADKRKQWLECKEKELVAKEKELVDREQVEIQNIVAEHNSVLDAKRHEFETEMEVKRHAFNEELQKNQISVEKRETAVSCKEEELIKRESILEGKVTKLADEKKDLEMQSKLLRTREEDLKIKEMEVQNKACLLADDVKELAISKAKLEVEWKHVKSEKTRILADTEHLRVTEQERAEFHELQLKLKEEIEEFRMLKGLVTKEREELKQDRENFEREWDVLDEKMASLSLEAKKLNEEKERLEKWKYNEEERMSNELLAARANINKELDELKLRKEAFEGEIELEKSQIFEKLRQEQQDMDRQLENKEHELQIEMRKKLEMLEHKFRMDVAEFNKIRETGLGHISSLRESASLDMQKMKRQHDIFEREKEEYISQREKIEAAQLEIQNDIDSLHSLSRNLKSQREEFVRERDLFLSLVDKYKICQNCGVTITDFAVPRVHSLKEISPLDNASPPGSSSGRMSWLRSCTKKFFGFSPGRKHEDASIMDPDVSSSLDHNHNGVETMEVSRDSFNNQKAESDDLIGRAETPVRVKTVEEAPGASLGMEINPLEVHSAALDCGIGFMGRENMVPSVDVQDDFTMSSALPKGNSRPEPKKKGRGRVKGKSLKRTRSVQAVVEESKSILERRVNGERKGSNSRYMDTQEDISHSDPSIPHLGHKRHLAQMSGSSADYLDADIDPHSENISEAGLRKRRQTSVLSTQTTSDKRYNLRLSTVAGGHTKGPKIKAPSQQHAAEPSDATVKNAAESDQIFSQLAAKGDEKGIQALQQVSTDSIVEVTNLTLEKIGEEEDEVNGIEVVNTSGRNGDWHLNEDAEDVESDEDSEENRLNASVGKKIWNFFTS